ncbi:MAG: hypothetical protein AB7N76_36920 [Planctomycetota bacterium]
MSEANDQREIVSPPLLFLALLVWFCTTYFHKLGLKIAGQVFAWARRPGALSPDGGAAGMKIFENGMALGLGAVALVVMLAVAWRLRRATRAQLAREATSWTIWAALLILIWKNYIVYATELIHFGQYAVVGALLALAIGRGRYPLPAFLVACALGGIDELYQHYVLATYQEGLHVRMDHWMDFTDPILDALGAAGAILPCTTWARLREDEGGGAPPDTSRALTVALVLLGLFLLPLLLLDPVQVSETLGYYRLFPYWGEYDNYKPTHWPGPQEGVPALLASLLVLGTIVDPRRKALSLGGVLLLVALAVLAVQPFSRKTGMPVHRRVPYASAARISSGLVVDGKLDEPEWQTAPRLGPFVRSQDGGPCRNATYARLLSAQEGLYVAFECEDQDIWARDVPPDTKTLPGDEVVEVFLDDGGDEVTYYELEVSPRNVLYDLFCFIPSAPVDYSHWQPFISMRNWSGPGIRHAVHIEGELDLLPESADGRYAPERKLGGDRRWTVELLIPWDDLRTEPWNDNPMAPMPPKPGQRWRIGLFRFERYRPTEQELAGEPFSEEQARQLLGAEWFDYLREASVLQPIEVKDAQGQVMAQPPEARRYERKAVYLHKDECQAWSPTWHPLALTHRPYWFGELEFK